MNALVRAPLDGEILGPADVITVTAAMHPLKVSAEVLVLPAGLSLAEIVDQVGEHCKVTRLARGADVSIAGHPIDEALWSRVRVKAGAHVMVRARAGKGMGNIFRSLLQIALAVFATFIVGPAGFGIAAAIGGTAGQIVASLAAGAIMIGGGMLLNALFPPSQTKSQDNSPSYSISAGKNGAVKWGPIPSQLGKTRSFPKYAAMPYTEFVGDDQYLRMLVVWGYGPLKVEDIKIGDTSIDEYDDVEIETFEGYATDGQQTLYPAEVVQDDISVDPAYNEPVVRTSAEDANEIVLDFVAPGGVARVTTKGKLDNRTVSFQIEMSPADADTWTDKGIVSITAKTNQPLRRSYRYPVAQGKYDIRVTRTTTNSEATTELDDVTWTAIKTFRTAPPIDFAKPLAITALRIRATKQLNGVVDNLSAVLTTVAASWSGSAWVLAQPTRNPADLFRHVLQGPANARPQADSRIDLPTLQAWADLCTTRGYTFDMYRDFTASVRDTLADIAAAGRAVPVFKDGKWSVAWEDDDAPVIQHFTPRNSRDFRWTQTYRVMPHALRCKFVNAAKDYIEDEILVYRAGYNKGNATLTEQVEFPGVTSTELIYKHGLYRIADAEERPAVYTLTVDFEHLVAQRADRVAVQHDVIRQGICSGRIQAVSGQQLTLDEPAVMEAGKLYGIRVRLSDGTSIVRPVTTVAGVQSVITITGTAPAVGDLYSFGERDHETGIYRILRIRPGEDLSAEVDLVDDGENVQAGDDETEIPGGTVTEPPTLAAYKPFGLRAESLVLQRATGNVHVVRVYWQAVTGPEYASFEILGSSSDGSVREVVDGITRAVDFEELQSDTWTFQVRAILADSRVTPPSNALVFPLDVPWDDLGVTPDNFGPGFQEVLDQINERTDAGLYIVGEGSRELRDRLIDNTLATVEQDARNVLDKQELRESLTARAGQLQADYELKITAVVTDLGAATSRIETLEVTTVPAVAAVANSALSRVTTAENNITALGQDITDINVALPTMVAATTAAQNAADAANNNANTRATQSAFDGLAAEVSDIDGAVEAHGDALTMLTGVVGDFSTSALIRIATVATETGASSTVGISVAAAGGGGTSEAAILISAVAGAKSMIGLLADYTYFRGPDGSTAKPIVFVDGVAKMNLANIGEFSAGIGTSFDGLMVVDWNNRKIVFSE